MIATQYQRSIRQRMSVAVSSIKWGKVREAVTGYLFIMPALLLFLVYYAYAIVRSLYLSLTNYRMLDPGPTSFVGFENYRMALTDQWVIVGFGKAAYYTVLFYIGALLFPLIVAIVVDRVSNRRVQVVYRVLIFLPVVVPAPMVFRLWRWMYMPSFGLVNYFLVDKLHLLNERPNWLVTPGLEIPSVVVVSWWALLGLTVMFFLAGLDGIPKELYEAAQLDGANTWQEVRYITLPLLKNTLMVWMILRIGAFAVVEPMMALWPFDYGVAPTGVWTWAYYAWFKGFRSGRMPLGYTSSIGWLGATVMIIVAFAARWIFREKGERS